MTPAEIEKASRVCSDEVDIAASIYQHTIIARHMTRLAAAVREECIEIIAHMKSDGSEPTTSEDAIYDMACDDCAEAVRDHSIRLTPEGESD